MNKSIYVILLREEKQDTVDILTSNCSIVRVSHFNPMYCGSHVHLKPEDVLVHVPWRQGFDEHDSTFQKRKI